MKKLQTSSVRLVLADPPYGVGNAAWDGDAGYLEFAHKWLAETVRILQPGGTLLYFSSPCTLWSSRMNVMLEDELKMNHQQTLSWIYGQGKRALTALKVTTWQPGDPCMYAQVEMPASSR